MMEGGRMRSMVKTALVLSILVAASWAQAAPADAPSRSDRPMAIQAGGGLSLLELAEALFDRLLGPTLESTRVSVGEDDQQAPPEPVFPTLKATSWNSSSPPGSFQASLLTLIAPTGRTA